MNLLDGLRKESLYYNAYYRLRQPLLEMLFDGVAWDKESAENERQRLTAEKSELKSELDRLCEGFHLYTVYRFRSPRIIELYAEQRRLREAKKGLRKGLDGWREAKDAVDRVAAELKRIRGTDEAFVYEFGEGLSGARVCEFLYEKLGLNKKWKRRKESGKRTLTVDEVALKHLIQEHPERELLLLKILRHRRCEKLCSTYLNPTKLLSPIDGRFHSHYKTFGTQSGRLSSGSDPWSYGGNSQNIDREYKFLFLPD